jgi:hypothetical protein
MQDDKINAGGALGAQIRQGVPPPNSSIRHLCACHQKLNKPKPGRLVMSFNIFASGTGTRGVFNYTRNNCADGDLFEAAAVMNAMRAAGPSRIGIAEGVADYVLPSAESQARTSIQAHLGTATRAHLGDGVTMLASCNQARQGWISVSATRRRVAGMWPDATGFARYDFTPNVQPASEFMQRVIPVLTATSMNNWGVLLQIDQALRGYFIHIHGRGRPMIQVQLQK